ncbi:PQQ enzyme repeat protein [Oesophagostomum dentatum]|uniref:PQQ enzyme repeat protein n=1 Tax=Oesophagostomum dentatum TaxID=61180 RepID=A0A0B1TNE2_OESDE|nr:PQQ enzyme repeat protein [Oesophagostomum dentatum]
MEAESHKLNITRRNTSKDYNIRGRQKNADSAICGYSRDSGEEVILSSFAVRDKVDRLKYAFRGITAGAVALHIKRSSELVCAVAALIELHIPFTILHEGIDAASIGAGWIFDGKQVRERFRTTSDDVILCATSFCFDPSIVELFLCFTRLSDVEVVAACSHSGVVVCIRVHDGFCLWKTRLNCRFESSLAECDGHFVVGGYDGGVYFLLANTGEVWWRFACGDAVKAACAVDIDGRVYVPAYDRKLYKLDVKNKKCIWSCSIQSGSPATPIIAETCVIVTTIKGNVEAIDVETGSHTWLYQAQAPIFSSVVTLNKTAFFGSVDGMITSIGCHDGIKENAVCVGEPIFARICVAGGFLYIVTERGSLFFTDLTLNILRHFVFSDCTFVVPAAIVDPCQLGLVSSSGLFILFNKKNVTAHAFRLGAGKVFSSVILLKDKKLLLCGCRDDFLRCFKLLPQFFGQ